MTVQPMQLAQAAVLGVCFGWGGLLNNALAESGNAVPPRAAVRMAVEWLPFAQPSAGPMPRARAIAPLDQALGPQLDWLLSPADRRLSIALQRWSALAGWQLVWEAERDFPIEVEVRLQGAFSSVLEEVMGSLSDSDYPLRAVMNTQGRVLRIRHQYGGPR